VQRAGGAVPARLEPAAASGFAMHTTLELFLRYGYLIVFGWVLLEQLGIPLPSTPILLTAGTLTATRHMRIEGFVAAVIAGSLLSDTLWFRLGGRYGSTVTRWLCRFSLEAASCVRRTEDRLVRHGAAALLLVKFVPGLNTLAAPLAGQSRMPYRTFLLYDLSGAFLWGTSLILLGRFFGDAIRRNQDVLSWLSRSAVVLVLLVVVAIVAYRYGRQRAFLNKIRTLRVEPSELKQMMDRGEDLFLVDLRHPLDLLPDPRVIPGAVRLTPNELLRRHAEIPRDRDVILYCTCPSEATSAKVALTLRRFGIERIRPLRGGYDAWKSEGYPLEPVIVADAGRPEPIAAV
jgi:membrane protein DedA with SNARE-associated domain/rhodanese-related sulfurtransferase